MGTTIYYGPIIDAHHHLWPYGLGRHPWLDAGGTREGGHSTEPLAPLRRDFLVSDYLRDMRGQGVVASVHVEAGWSGGSPGEETSWLDTLDRSSVAARHVFRVDLAAPDAAERVAVEACHPRAVGVRDIVAWHPDPARSFADEAGRMSDKDWHRGLAALDGTGLAFDLMLFPPQMGEAEALIDAFPSQVFVLNHCGSPADRSEAGMAAWAEGLRRLADRPNLLVKVSNPVAYDQNWTVDSLRVVIDHCLDRFGAERSMWGSDFPVFSLHASFHDLISAFRDILSVRSTHDQRAFFHDTAARTYRLMPKEAP